eukprot:TRINITY_DN3155_c0_g1_i1.p1 TRINITY_DN3155_c0_g1~~TRINITY_DN3155_c0_g1_i1.p1  ORF type:complete len:163 (+),score=26.89 TRINITY_DN3155_c0_g1_i1:60-548(+)
MLSSIRSATRMASLVPARLLNRQMASMATVFHEDGVAPIFFEKCPADNCGNACAVACGEKVITIVEGRGTYTGGEDGCVACLRCVSKCPANNVAVVDFDGDDAEANIQAPNGGDGEEVTLFDNLGMELGQFEVEDVMRRETVSVVTVALPREVAVLASFAKF